MLAYLKSELFRRQGLFVYLFWVFIHDIYLELWNKLRNLSIEEYKKIYSRLNINFDVYSGESLQSSSIPQIIDLLKTLLADPDKLMNFITTHGGLYIVMFIVYHKIHCKFN